MIILIRFFASMRIKEEEICIKDTYDYLYSQLDEPILKDRLKKKYGAEAVDQLNFIDILKYNSPLHPVVAAACAFAPSKTKPHRQNKTTLKANSHYFASHLRQIPFLPRMKGFFLAEKPNADKSDQQIHKKRALP